MKRKNTVKKNANCYIIVTKLLYKIDKGSANEIKTVESFLKDNHKIKGNSNNS